MWCVCVCVCVCVMCERDCVWESVCVTYCLTHRNRHKRLCEFHDHSPEHDFTPDHKNKPPEMEDKRISSQNQIRVGLEPGHVTNHSPENDGEHDCVNNLPEMEAGHVIKSFSENDLSYDQKGQD